MLISLRVLWEFPGMRESWTQRRSLFRNYFKSRADWSLAKAWKERMSTGVWFCYSRIYYRHPQYRSFLCVTKLSLDCLSAPNSCLTEIAVGDRFPQHVSSEAFSGDGTGGLLWKEDSPVALAAIQWVSRAWEVIKWMPIPRASPW